MDFGEGLQKKIGKNGKNWQEQRERSELKISKNTYFFLINILLSISFFFSFFPPVYIEDGNEIS